MPPQGDLTTLTQVRRAVLQQNIASGNDNSDDDLFKRYIAEASAVIQRSTQRTFTPYRSTRVQDYYGLYDLNLDADLLDVLALTNGDGNSIALENVRTQPANDFPKWRLSLSRNSGYTFVWVNDPQQAIEVEGIWGYHNDYPSAWVDTLAVVPSGGINSSATSMTTPAADGLDAVGRTRFEVGGLYRIDDEYIKVVAIAIETDPAADTLTIRRAQLGTTAAAHDQDAAIERWQVLPDVEWQCERLVVWAYQHRDSVNSITFLDTNITMRDETLRDIFAKLEAYRPVRLGAV